MPFEADQPIAKQLFFELESRRILRDMGYEDWLEQVKTQPHYDEVTPPWAIAVSKFNVGTPRLKVDSPEEAEELTKFAIQLRFGDVHQTLEQYSDLRERRQDDKDFIRWMGKTIHLRDKPDQTPLSLKYYVLLFWINGFLWAIEPLDRADVLFHGFSVPIKRPTAEAIRKIVARMKLKGCEHFRRTYPQAPIKFVYNRAEQSFYFYFDFPSPGQESPLPRED